MRRGKEILKKLEDALEFKEEEFVSLMASKSRNSFEVLVTTIVSQNTNDKNTAKAMARLKELLGRIDPEGIEKLSLSELEGVLRPAGLYRQKAKIIKEVASALKGGALERILNLNDLDEARRELMKLPGVGPKTADVVLSFTTSDKPTIAVDRHIARVATRLGLANREDYNEIREALMKLFDPEDYLKAHLLLIKLGRVYCRPRNPKCEECPLGDICRYHKEAEKGK
ncbi:MAG: endonuclease III [Candidatus Korarchaeota archaeon]|nr:endonuclease III [Candidatus Korarchaeota archaeon]